MKQRLLIICGKFILGTESSPNLSLQGIFFEGYNEFLVDSWTQKNCFFLVNIESAKISNWSKEENTVHENLLGHLFLTSTMKNWFLTHVSWIKLHACFHLNFWLFIMWFKWALRFYIHFLNNFKLSPTKSKIFVLNVCSEKLNLTASTGFYSLWNTCIVFNVINLKIGFDGAFNGKMRNIIFSDEYGIIEY